MRRKQISVDLKEIPKITIETPTPDFNKQHRTIDSSNTLLTPILRFTGRTRVERLDASKRLRRRSTSDLQPELTPNSIEQSQVNGHENDTRQRRHSTSDIQSKPTSTVRNPKPSRRSYTAEQMGALLYKPS
jgi:hypothetical protein